MGTYDPNLHGKHLSEAEKQGYYKGNDNTIKDSWGRDVQSSMYGGNYSQSHGGTIQSNSSGSSPKN